MSPPILLVHREQRWLVPPGGPAVDCTRHRLLRRLLAELVRARVEQVGEPVAVAALVAAGWPGERILPRAARNRVHVAVHRLRGLGLAGWIEHCDAGWRLSPALIVEVSAAPAAITAP